MQKTLDKFFYSKPERKNDSLKNQAASEVDISVVRRLDYVKALVAWDPCVCVIYIPISLCPVIFYYFYQSALVIILLLTQGFVFFYIWQLKSKVILQKADWEPWHKSRRNNKPKSWSQTGYCTECNSNGFTWVYIYSFILTVMVTLIMKI